jgi:uncharacterized membrane protein
MEAFSDGVLAIIITITVLEMKVPHGDTLATLKPSVAGIHQLCSRVLYTSEYTGIIIIICFTQLIK